MRGRKVTYVVMLLTSCLISRGASAAPPHDAYITGYAAALLEHKFHVPNAALQVQHGVVRIRATDLTGVDQQQLVKSLRAIPGVVQVEVDGQGRVLSATPLDQSPPPTLQPHGSALETETVSAETSFLPQGYLFDQRRGIH
jgi:Protein of unknown function (DUF1207)